MAVSYEVRVVEYKTNKGPQICITLKNEALGNMMAKDTVYWRVWGKANRLYFLTAAPTNGIKLSDAGTLTISRADVVEELRKYIGEYAHLNYDEGLHYYYINLDERMEAEVDAGAQAGISRKQPTRAVNGETMAKTSIMVDEPIIETPTAEESKPIVTVKPAYDATGLLVKSLIECVLTKKQEAAYEIASILQTLQKTSKGA